MLRRSCLAKEDPDGNASLDCCFCTLRNRHVAQTSAPCVIVRSYSVSPL
jgi:hypothetical protein